MATIPGGSIPTDGDPNLANIGETRKPVELHDILTAPLAFVEKSPLQIEWVDARSQPKFDKYYQIACTNTTRGEFLEQLSRHASKSLLQGTANTSYSYLPAI
jgi:hypothetical protein